jgi:hypothetical protein
MFNHHSSLAVHASLPDIGSLRLRIPHLSGSATAHHHATPLLNKNFTIP